MASDVCDAAGEALAAAIGNGITAAGARAATGLDGAVADALIATLERRGLLRRDGTRMLPPGQVATDPAAETVARLLADAGLRPPGMVELGEQTGLRPQRLVAVLAELRAAGTLIAAGDLWFDSQVAADAVDAARQLLAEGPKGIGELRDLWAVGRRHALALAAHLDASGVTRRVGDSRVLRRGATMQ